MLINILDLRERAYRWSKIMAVLESATKDNEAEDADQVEAELGVQVDYAEKQGISVREAVLWAEQAGGPVTLYLYDPENADEGQ